MDKRSEKKGFAGRLRQLRTERNLSQAELAKMVGLHVNHLGRYERGDSQPTADKITKLAAALGVSGDYLLDSTTDDMANAAIANRELLNLFKEVEKLPSEDQSVIKRLMLAFINERKIRELTAS